ncbi:sensor domain-containing diguanylate cyclase [Cryobacterium tepidiphilum]|uniref:sensor domain-containing diguanylate cyclase n=1 Tax=Cryobacterium tepidiphilum TaxID=2486026 RepID=UPI0011CDEF52|nr:sensor domain-containing diguanylate cyclase [Cryobacterium tepidiphilum]
MTLSVTSPLNDSDEDDVITGVRDARRLKAVADADLHGHMADLDLDAVVATLRLACASPIVVVNIVGPDQQTYAAETGIGAECTSVPDTLSFCAEVVDSGEALTVPDAAAHPIYSQNPMVLTGAIGSYAGVPLIDNGVVLGSVAMFDRGAREFSPEVLDILRHQGKLAGSVLALRRSARMDALTGLPNRVLYGDRLAGAVARLERNGGMVCVMYLDIDDFKTINDTFGHGGGDEVLIELGRRLVGVLRPTDTVARFGGDEFVTLCENLGSVDDAEQLAARVVAAAAEPWEIQGRSRTVHVSIGIAVTDSADIEPLELLDEADAAMYLAKSVPGSTSVVAPAPSTES